MRLGLYDRVEEGFEFKGKIDFEEDNDLMPVEKRGTKLTSSPLITDSAKKFTSDPDSNVNLTQTSDSADISIDQH